MRTCLSSTILCCLKISRYFISFHFHHELVIPVGGKREESFDPVAQIDWQTVVHIAHLKKHIQLSEEDVVLNIALFL